MKDELEICVKSLDKKEEVIEKLSSFGFEVKEEFMLKDIYYVDVDKEISLENSKDILSNYVLIRESNNKKEFVIKKKKYDEKGNIISQFSCKCPILDKQKGIDFIRNLGYKELFRINDYNMLMSNGNNEIYIQDVEDLGIYLEMESKNIYSGNNGNNIDELIDNFNYYNINIVNNNYFAKKSFDMLEKIKNKK